MKSVVKSDSGLLADSKIPTCLVVEQYFGVCLIRVAHADRPKLTSQANVQLSEEENESGDNNCMLQMGRAEQRKSGRAKGDA